MKITQADRDSAEEILVAYGESDPPPKAKLEHFAAIIATAMSEEREALRLAKTKLKDIVSVSTSGMVRKHCVWCGDVNTYATEALTAIEKVTG